MLGVVVSSLGRAVVTGNGVGCGVGRLVVVTRPGVGSIVVVAGNGGGCGLGFCHD